MESILKVAGIGIVGAAFSLLIKKNNSELALLLSISVCLAIVLVAMSTVKPIIDFIKQMKEVAGLSSSVLSPLLKAVGIGIVTKISSSLCADAKEGAVSNFIELCGTVLAIYVSLPLMSAVLELISSMM